MTTGRNINDETSSSASANKFRSKDHAQRLFRVVVNRRVVTEKGIDLKEGVFAEIQEQFIARGWQTLCKTPTHAYKRLVQEFYANNYRVKPDALKEHFIMIRGKRIYFGEEAINRTLCLEYIRSSIDYHMLERDGTWDPNEVLRTICISSAQWVLDAKGAPHKLNRSNLLPIHKVWFTFIQHTLLPSSNIFDVFAKRALLISCIMRGIGVDAGSLIVDNMEKLAQANPRLLGYPFLINKLIMSKFQYDNKKIPGDLGEGIRALDPIIAPYIMRLIAEGNQRPGSMEQPRSRSRASRRIDSDDMNTRLGRLEEGMGRLEGDITNLKREAHHHTDFLSTLGLLLVEKLNLDASRLLTFDLGQGSGMHEEDDLGVEADIVGEDDAGNAGMEE